jgi:hypothetical protein
MITQEEARRAAGLLTEEEFAAMVRITMQTLAIWRVKGYGPPFVKFGRKPFYRIDDIKVWMDTHVEWPVNTLGSRASASDGVMGRDESDDQLELDLEPPPKT